MAREYLNFLFDNQPLPPDSGNAGDDDLPLRFFEKYGFGNLDKHADAPDVFHYGELDRLMGKSIDDGNPPIFTPSWEQKKDPFWDFFSTNFSPWELEQKFLGIRPIDKPSYDY